MSHATHNTTTIWVALLTSCEGREMDLTDADTDALICAEQMRDAGLLQESEPHHFMLTSRGMSLLTLLERLRDWSLES